MSEKVDYLVVYGDSYSDIHQGTKRTNGPVWSEQLAKQWNTELVSFAKSGATFCKNSKQNGSWLKKQVEQNNKNQEESSSVHAIFLGTTDLIEAKGEVTTTKAEEWISCIKDQITHIYSQNANSKVIIMSVPALEFSPYALTHSEETTNLKQNIIDFNVALEEKVAEWHSEISEKIEFFDTYLVFSDVLGDPSVANIENVDDAYWDKCQGKCSEDIDSYLWYDNIHVTGAGHKAIANTVQSKEFFNLQGLTADATSGNSTLEDITGVSFKYTRYVSWLIFGAILLMMLYMFRHNRTVLSLKKKIQTNAAKLYSRRNNHTDYTLV